MSRLAAPIRTLLVPLLLLVAVGACTADKRVTFDKRGNGYVAFPQVGVGLRSDGRINVFIPPCLSPIGRRDLFSVSSYETSRDMAGEPVWGFVAERDTRESSLVLGDLPPGTRELFAYREPKDGEQLLVTLYSLSKGDLADTTFRPSQLEEGRILYGDRLISPAVYTRRAEAECRKMGISPLAGRDV